MAETLLTPSTIKIFGRLITDLTFNYDQATTIIGGNNLLQRQLSTAVTPITLTGGSIIAGNSSVTVTSTVGLEPNMNVSSPTTGAAFSIPTTIVGPVLPGTQFNVIPAPLVTNNNITINLFWQPNLARIYGFSYEGVYYGLPGPAIFLVHGAGTQVGNWAFPSTMEQSGLAGKDGIFPVRLVTLAPVLLLRMQRTFGIGNMKGRLLDPPRPRGRAV